MIITTATVATITAATSTAIIMIITIVATIVITALTTIASSINAAAVHPPPWEPQEQSYSNHQSTAKIKQLRWAKAA